MVIFLPKSKKGKDEDGVMENISEEDPPPWVYVQGKLFSRSRQGYFAEKILKKLGMIKCVIIEKE